MATMFQEIRQRGLFIPLLGVVGGIAILSNEAFAQGPPIQTDSPIMLGLEGRGPQSEAATPSRFRDAEIHGSERQLKLRPTDLGPVGSVVQMHDILVPQIATRPRARRRKERTSFPRGGFLRRERAATHPWRSARN